MLKVITFALTLVATPLTAETEDNCVSIGELAHAIMGARQSGVDLGRAMRLAGGNELVEAIVLMAYNEPRFSSDQYRQRAATDFANTWMLACYEQSN